MNVMGIMSGTSLDGVDYALCRIERGRVRLLELKSRRFPDRLRSRLEAAAANEADAHELAQLHHDLGRFYARRLPFGTESIDLIGLHGQTVFHHPDRKAPATFQLGEPSYLSEATECPVVANFRVADLAAGGQGAPLATAFHVFAFRDARRTVAVNNLGGISNVTLIRPKRARGEDVVACSYDTGPGVMPIDLAVRRLTAGRLKMDKGGRLAAQGGVDHGAVRRWLKLPWFHRKPPKSTGREMFGEPFLERALSELRGRSLATVIATLTEFTAKSIAQSYRKHLPEIPDRIVVCGGGALNKTLVARIAAALNEAADKNVEIQTCEDLGWPAQSVEPAAFSLLAWLRWRRKSYPHWRTTGANRPVILGQLLEPGGVVNCRRVSPAD